MNAQNAPERYSTKMGHGTFQGIGQVHTVTGCPNCPKAVSCHRYSYPIFHFNLKEAMSYSSGLRMLVKFLSE